MSTLGTFEQEQAEISRLWDEENYDQALAEVEKLLETRPGNPQLHILKANLIQLQEEPKYELDEAEHSLRRAVELDNGAPTALIELGHYLDNVANKPESAAEVYADAVPIARRLHLDGLIGHAKALRQLGRKNEFKRCLDEILFLTQFDSAADEENAEEIEELLTDVSAA